MKKMSIKRESWFMVVMVKVRRRTRGSSEETAPEEHKGLELIEIPSWIASTQMGRGRAVKEKGVFEMLDPLAWTGSELGMRTPS